MDKVSVAKRNGKTDICNLAGHSGGVNPSEAGVKPVWARNLLFKFSLML